MKSSSANADKWYVYAYRDPNDSMPFYIGKGTDLRVFSHAKGYGSEETTRRISSIKKRRQEPIIEIIARDLSQEVALYIEMALIELIGIANLTNKQRGHGWRRHGSIDASQLSAHLVGESLTVEDFKGIPTIVFRINKLYRRGMSAVELYDITRCCWGVNLSKAKKCQYAMSAYEGRILEIYEIADWFDAGTTFMIRESKKSDEGRKEFVGRVCKTAKIRKRFLGKSISQLPGYDSRTEFLYLGL